MQVALGFSFSPCFWVQFSHLLNLISTYSRIFFQDMDQIGKIIKKKEKKT
jgi:hypothetical protein